MLPLTPPLVLTRYSSQVQTEKDITTMIKQVFTYGFIAVLMTACQPKLQIVAPDKPIEINLNIKIDQEVRVRLDEDVDDLITNNPDLF